MTDRVIKKLIYNTPNQLEPPLNLPEEQRDTAVETNKIYITLPYCESLSNRLVNLIPRDNVNVALKNVKPIRGLFSRIKDMDPICELSDVVYLIPCENCDSVYIGQTSTKLKQRMALHRSNIKMNKKDLCALTRHSTTMGHLPDFANVKILDNERNMRKRTFLEMVRIRQWSNNMNSKKDMENLSSIYAHLIDLDAVLMIQQQGGQNTG